MAHSDIPPPEGEDKPEEKEHERRRLERLLPEVIKRLMEAGYERITEGPENVREFVQEHRPKHGILVHCAEGVQRSPAIVILILIQDRFTLFDAFEFVEKKCRWPILPTFEMLASIARLDLNGEHVDEAAIKQYYRDRFRLIF